MLLPTCIYNLRGVPERMLLILQLARLSGDDTNAVYNMRFLGGSDTKKISGGAFSLKFDVHKVSAYDLSMSSLRLLE